MPPLAGGSESVRERIERLAAEGRKSAADIERAIALWRDRLQGGVPLPNGEAARISLDDLYHLMVDDRILRKPERIELLLSNIFEVRAARAGRRRALSSWLEGDQRLYGYAIIDPDQGIRTLHVIDHRDLRKYRNEAVLWSLSELQLPGTDPA